jgi:hypothetical protein
MTTFGAVPVSAFNIHRLLSNKEAVLLFPGKACCRGCPATPAPHPAPRSSPMLLLPPLLLLLLPTARCCHL